MFIFYNFYFLLWSLKTRQIKQSEHDKLFFGLTAYKLYPQFVIA